MPGYQVETNARGLSLEPSHGPATGGVLLVGSVPLRSAEEVFQVMATELGDRITQLPDGETGPRSDWIVAVPRAELPPGVRGLPARRPTPSGSAAPEGPRRRVAGHAALRRPGLRRGGDLLLRHLRPPQAGRAGPPHCRFQVSLPTPLAPIAAFVAPEDQARIEPPYEERMLHELDGIFDAIPHDQLAIQWDTNFEFAMLDEVMPVWFGDRGRHRRAAGPPGPQHPAGVQLGYHFCHGHEAHHRDRPYHAQPLVDVANALSLSLSRSLDWLHLPVAGDRVDLRFFETLAQLGSGPRRGCTSGCSIRRTASWGPGPDRRGAALRPRLRRRHRLRLGPPPPPGRRAADRAAPGGVGPDPAGDPAALAFAWPAGWERVPDDDWTHQPVDALGEAYDNVDHHSWYRNLDATVEELSHLLNDGDILVDYSGGTGILLDRLKLRMFDVRAGAVIVDSSPKFLRGAGEVPRRPRRRAPAAPLPEAREAAAATRRGARSGAPRASGRRDRLDQRDPPLSRPGRHGGVVAAGAAPRRPRPHQLRQHPQPACSPQRVDPRRDRVGGRRPRRGARAQRSGVRELPPTSTTRNGWPPTPPTIDRVFLQPCPLDFYLETPSSGPQGRVGAGGEHRGRVDDWYELLRTYHDAVLGWVGGTEKIDGAPPSPEAVADRPR